MKKIMIHGNNNVENLMKFIEKYSKGLKSFNSIRLAKEFHYTEYLIENIKKQGHKINPEN